MSTRLSLRVQEKIGKLTASDQKLAEVILRDSSIIETHSATELAQIAGVSKATAARFFRRLGYRDFDEVKIQAREERNRTQPFSYASDAKHSVALGRSLNDHLELELNNLSRTFEELSPDHLREIVAMVEAAPRVWFLALGSDSWLASYGRQLFSRLRPNVLLLGLGGQALVEDLAMTGPRDVLFVPAIGPVLKSLRPVLAYARTTRMKVVAISDYTNMPLVRRYNATVLLCHVTKFGPIDSWTTAISMLRLLGLSFASHVGQPAEHRLELIGHISEELDLLE